MMRVLIAEDERITRASLARQLESWGHKVTAAEDGQAALDAYSAAEFDIVITDWEMPRLSGVELIRQIRQIERSEYVYVIMLTGRSDKTDVVNGIEAGADDFVSKPFDREELRVRLLAGERIVRLEQELSRQNLELRKAGERIRRDLDAAARVQRSMLPRHNVVTQHARTAWTYVPTDELAGDAVGLHLIDDRYLVGYVIDVSGHGIPAALLSVTAMHYMEPVPEATSLLRDMTGSSGLGTVQRPAVIAAELDRRFTSDSSDSHYFTMVLYVLDTHTGSLCLTCAGHPMPFVLRGDKLVAIDDVGGPPLALIEGATYQDAICQLQPGDRVYLFSDGVTEQLDAARVQQFGEERLRDHLIANCCSSLDSVVSGGIDLLAQWAGQRKFMDDVSLVAMEWLGPARGSD
jgi:phosphoserine phosphatase RsbU/P